MAYSAEIRELQHRLIGGLVNNPEQIPNVIEVIGDKPVFDKVSNNIYRQLVSLWENKAHIDIVTLSNLLEKASPESRYLNDALLFGEWTGLVDYAKLLVEHYIRRQIDDFGKEAIYRVKRHDDAFELMDWAEANISRIAEIQPNRKEASSSDAFRDAMAHIESVALSGFRGVQTGIRGIDVLMGGLQPTDLGILAGRPSSGKTALALQMANYNSEIVGVGTALFSYEMSVTQLATRIIARRVRVDSHRITYGRITDEELRIIKSASEELRRFPLYMEDCAGTSISDLRSKCRRLKREKDIGLIVIDYLQLISGNRKDTREQEISSISRALKAIAKELSTPVLCLSQLSRANEKRDDKKPILSDLRDSGAIEQDADIVMFVHSAHIGDDYRNLIIAKNRNGPVGDEIRLNFNAPFSEFS